VKATDLAPLLAQLRESFLKLKIAPQAILVLSNGLGLVELMRRWAGTMPHDLRSALARGTAWFGCRRESTERVRFAGPARLDWAWVTHPPGHPPHAPDRPDLSTLLRHGLTPWGIELVQEDSPEHLEWRKGAWNASMNALLALADAQNGELLTPGLLQDEFAALLRESQDVARADGVVLDARDQKLIWESINRTRTNWNSMHGDLRSGRPTELPFLNRWLVARARTLDLPVPAHERVLEAVDRFRGERGTCQESSTD